MVDLSITRWDGVIYGTNTVPRPMLYVKPTMEFLDIARNNDFKVIVHIEGSHPYNASHLGRIYPSLTQEAKCTITNRYPEMNIIRSIPVDFSHIADGKENSYHLADDKENFSRPDDTQDSLFSFSNTQNTSSESSDTMNKEHKNVKDPHDKKDLQ